MIYVDFNKIKMLNTHFIDTYNHLYCFNFFANMKIIKIKSILSNVN